MTIKTQLNIIPPFEITTKTKNGEIITIYLPYKLHSPAFHYGETHAHLRAYTHILTHTRVHRLEEHLTGKIYLNKYLIG